MSKIVAVISSPRKDANSATVVKAMAEAAKEKGHDVKVFNVAQLKDRLGCIACMACKKSGKCAVKDDLTPVIDAIRESDGVILSTAVYFGQSTAQYRLLEDRFFSFIDGSLAPTIAPKKFAVVVSAGSEGADAVADQIAGRMTSYFKFECLGKVVVTDGMSPQAAAQNPAVLAQAAEIGRKF